MNMSMEDRVLGRLEEFQRHSEKNFERMEEAFDIRFTKIEEKLEGLNEFKWRVLGAAVALSVIFSGLIELFSVIRVAHG